MTTVAVIGGGLAGMAAALACADAGAQVTLVEKRKRLGGLTWSFEHDGVTMDNGQHVFLRCCTAYQDFLGRIGSAGDVELQDRLDVTVLSASPAGPPREARLHRDRLRAPLHMARSLAGFGLVPLRQRALIGPAALAMRRLDLDDPALDDVSFGSWLARHHQGPAAVKALWELICLATVNLSADEASLAMAAKVFRTGLLDDHAGADIGWSRVPLGLLHGQRGLSALKKAGVTVRLGDEVLAVRPAGQTSGTPSTPGTAPGWQVATAGGQVSTDAVIVALPNYCVESVLPAGALPGQVRPSALGSSPIVNVHVRFDRPVTSLPFAAGLGTMAQWVFDRTESSGAGGGQYLVISLSAADEYAGTRPEQLGREMVESLGAIFPEAKKAQVLSTFVTREQHATFRATPGSAVHRSPAGTRLAGLALAGAWTATGWPPTMESAVRSGTNAARAALAGCSHPGNVKSLTKEDQ